MESHSKIFVVAALTVGASLGFGAFSVAQAASVPLPIQSQPLELQSGIVSFSVHPANLILCSVALEEFEPEPNLPPQGTGGTGTR
jgi:hypothetical protein